MWSACIAGGGRNVQLLWTVSCRIRERPPTINSTIDKPKEEEEEKKKAVSEVSRPQADKGTLPPWEDGREKD
jgi:hypothetical protein